MRFYRIIRDKGVGGFMEPPGSYAHRYSVHEYTGPRRRTVIGVFGLDYLDDPAADASEEIREQARTIREQARITPSELWIRSVYGYFRNMYVPESGSTSAQDLIRDPRNRLPASRHAAAAFIRRRVPGHEPRTDLISDPGRGYGSYPCDRCGARVQYEAKFDALTVVTVTLIPDEGNRWSYQTRCPDSPDGKHHVAPHPSPASGPESQDTPV